MKAKAKKNGLLLTAKYPTGIEYIKRILIPIKGDRNNLDIGLYR